MFNFAVRRPSAAAAAATLAVALGTMGWCAVSSLVVAQTTAQWAAKTTPAKADKSEKSGSDAAAKGAQAIVVLVNDEPVTAYEIEQRARFLSVSGNINEQVKEQFKRLTQAESTNQQVRKILEEVIRNNPGKSREQVLAIFEERKKQFGVGLQKQALDAARAGLLPNLRKEAKEELIDERLKLQEAKKIGVEIGDDDVKRILKGLSDQNKMTEDQFAQHIKSMGVDINTLKERFRVTTAWREVIRRRFAAQIAITQRDVDRMLSAAASEAGEDTVELQVHKITLPMPGTIDQAAMAKRYTEADALRRQYGGCKTMADLAKGSGDARFEDMKFIKPSSIPEPTRSMLLSAKDGDVLPPTTAVAGIEIYAVCSRRALRADDAQRTKAQEELQQREYEIMARRHLRDLRQDATIEYR